MSGWFTCPSLLKRNKKNKQKSGTTGIHSRWKVGQAPGLALSSLAAYVDDPRDVIQGILFYPTYSCPYSLNRICSFYCTRFTTYFQLCSNLDFEVAITMVLCGWNEKRLLSFLLYVLGLVGRYNCFPIRSSTTVSVNVDRFINTLITGCGLVLTIVLYDSLRARCILALRDLEFITHLCVFD